MTELRATYRLQLRGGVGFAEARRLVPQLARLGISHLYLSPVLRARRGSPHGYDVVDPTEVDPALGGEAGLRALSDALRRHAMGLVLDVVPNHMAADPESAPFRDVLAHGPASRFAPWFDVDWGSPTAVAAGRHAPLLLPWLGAPWREAAAAGEIAPVRSRGQLRLRHGGEPGCELPLDPAGLAPLLQAASQRLQRSPGPRGRGADRPASGRPPPSSRPAPGAGRRRSAPAAPARDEDARQLAELAARAHQLPRRAPDHRGAREDAVGAWEATLARLLRASRRTRDAVDAALAEASPALGTPGGARLERVLAAQPYRLGPVRRTARQLNWRRFFDVNGLIALRAEDQEVFHATHARILALVEAGLLDGLRVDHVDGLLEPAVYLRRLRREVSERLPLAMRSRFGLWVEKILAPGERLPQSWPVDGTTGYELARDVDALLLDPDGAAALEADWRRRTGVRRSFAEEAARSKRLAADELLTADLERTTSALVAELEAQGEPEGARPSRAALRTAVRETVVHLRRYRTYLDVQGRLKADARDAARAALRAARGDGRTPDDALDCVERRVLGGGAREPRSERARPPGFVERLQQLSGPVAAKGIEDTALYRFTPLASRCEVGVEPDAPLEVAVGAFHVGCEERARHWPRSLLAASTHDTKRSADVRARLDALSECPGAWARTLDALERSTSALRGRAGGRPAPDRQETHLLFQNLAGVWPLRGEPGLPPVRELRALRARLETVALKSAREARRRTGWLEPDADYEEALVAFVRGLLDPARSREALRTLDGFVREELAGPGLWNVLARLLLQGAAPGVPDLYQGDELPQLALVDPDNRRPVDFAARATALRGLERQLRADPARRRRALARALREPDGERAKLLVWGALLEARRQHPALFARGDHRPLHAEGPGAEHVVAFARRRGDTALLAVATRTGRLASGDPTRPPVGEDVWEKTRLTLPRPLAGHPLRSALTGERLRPGSALPLGRLLDPLPVALLIASGRS